MPNAEPFSQSICSRKESYEHLRLQNLHLRASAVGSLDTRLGSKLERLL
jgi:hypothetical protein